MVVNGAGKERVFVSHCSTVYLSNFVTFFVSRNVVWRQNYAFYFIMKQTYFCVSVTVLLFIMVVYAAGKERVFVSLCSAVYLSNFVAFVESRNVVWRQNYAAYFIMKQTCSESLKQSKPIV
jgi:hypothetical protein